jgi:glucose dehydrogenase
MGATRTARAYLAATLLIAVSLLAAACSSTSTPAGTTVINPKAAKPAGSWPYPNGDLANTRDAAGSVISSANGKLRWYYQGVTNDFMDHDMQTSPIAATISGEPAVIGSGKMGVVYAMNASTGRLIWDTRCRELLMPPDDRPASRARGTPARPRVSFLP